MNVGGIDVLSGSSDAVIEAMNLSVRTGGVTDAVTMSLKTGEPVEMGRLDATARDPEKLFVPHEAAGLFRLPIAAVGQTSISRRQVRLELLPEGRVRIANLSSSIAISCTGFGTIAPGTTVEHPLPLRLRVGQIAIVLDADDPDDSHQASGTLLALASMTEQQESGSFLKNGALSAIVAKMPPAAIDALVSWWRNVIAVLQSASNSDDFFQQASRAVVQLVGLDVGAVFLYENGGWRPACVETTGPRTAQPSGSVLRRLLEEKRTFFSRVDAGAEMLTSIAAIDTYVAAPIIDRVGAVIGAVYGHRSRDLADGAGAEITYLEALLVQTLASGVAAGLARMEQEKASLARKVQFEQFFSPELASQLESEPDLLSGRDADVSVLFCDIRGFSSVSERLGPAQTMDWVGSVLSTLSDQVAATGGVLVDYIGDELMAMWGAPSPQPEHAVFACHAARRMVECAAEIDSRWRQAIGCSTQFGIGVNSSLARVGNTGSSRKFKYGPLGGGVNVASRVQGATKYLKVPVVVTGSTRERLDDSFLVRRLCRVRLVNIATPVDLYEVDCAGGRQEMFGEYGAALAAFDAGDFSTAAKLLGNLLVTWPGDGPALVLLSRSVDCMIEEPRDFSPVWELPGK